jgi:hypothetical protein
MAGAWLGAALTTPLPFAHTAGLATPEAAAPAAADRNSRLEMLVVITHLWVIVFGCQFFPYLMHFSQINSP